MLHKTAFPHQTLNSEVEESTPSGPELANDVQRTHDGHESECQHEHTGRANAEARGVIRVKLQDAIASGLPPTPRSRPCAAPGARGWAARHRSCARASDRGRGLTAAAGTVARRLC